MDTSTIAAIATPGGRGGIGIIKISGPKAVSIATRLFSPANSEPKSQIHKAHSLNGTSCSGLKSHRLYYGHIVDPVNGRVLDEVIS